MNSLQKYLALVHERPDMFRNSGDIGEIKIITDGETHSRRAKAITRQTQKRR